MIKLLLIAGIAGAAFFAMRGGNSSTNLALRRLGGLLFLGVGALAVVFPNAVTWAANRVGVERGTDLLLYALVVVFCFVTIGLNQRLHDLERRLIELTRATALENAVLHEDTPNDDADEDAA